MSLPPKTITLPAKKQFNISTGVTRNGWKVGIYGPEGIGKSSLAALCAGAVFADIEDSMSDLEVKKVGGIEKWSDLRDWVQSLNKCIAGIDSITRAEDWSAQHVITTKKSNDGTKASDSLEDFKYGAGATFVTDEFRKLLSDIDAARKRDVSFIMIAHCRVCKFKNPDGSDYVRFEPRLIDTVKASNMLQWVQFLDHLAFINVDTAVTKGKAEGGGSRTIYLDTAPNRISKARGIDNTPLNYPEDDDSFWKLLGV